MQSLSAGPLPPMREHVGCEHASLEVIGVPAPASTTHSAQLPLLSSARGLYTTCTCLCALAGPSAYAYQGLSMLCMHVGPPLSVYPYQL